MSRIDLHETIRVMRALWERELCETGRWNPERAYFEVHPETFHALGSALAEVAEQRGTLAYYLAQMFPAGELSIDGVTVRRNLSLRPGMVRLIVAARETEVVNYEEAFVDEGTKGRKP